jgi:hypothetical protein
MAWNPVGTNTPWNRSQAVADGTQPWAPASGVDESQGQPYPDDIQAELQVPQAFGINLPGWVNPYALSLYSYPLPISQAPVRVASYNQRRAYLLLQNQGPGNIYVNFGVDVSPTTAVLNSNGLTLITSQFYEQIGGGDFDWVANMPRAQCFVTPDFVSVASDGTAGTTILVAEGIWRLVTPQGMARALQAAD